MRLVPLSHVQNRADLHKRHPHPSSLIFLFWLGTVNTPLWLASMSDNLVSTVGKALTMYSVRDVGLRFYRSIHGEKFTEQDSRKVVLCQHLNDLT